MKNKHLYVLFRLFEMKNYSFCWVSYYKGNSLMRRCTLISSLFSIKNFDYDRVLLPAVPNFPFDMINDSYLLWVSNLTQVLNINHCYWRPNSKFTVSSIGFCTHEQKTSFLVDLMIFVILLSCLLDNQLTLQWENKCWTHLGSFVLISFSQELSVSLSKISSATVQRRYGVSVYLSY